MVPADIYDTSCLVFLRPTPKRHFHYGKGYGYQTDRPPLHPFQTIKIFNNKYNDMFYTREQIQRLEKYRKTFETAVRSGFARNVGSIALKEIEEVYDEALGSHYSYNNGCSVCVLGFLKKVGEPFLKEAEKYRKMDEQKNEEQEANTNDSPEPKTNKRTRKKKDGTE